jgi:hypothetical protein
LPFEKIPRRDLRVGLRNVGRQIRLPQRYQTIGFDIGSGSSNTPWTTLKIAVFAPIPSASVITATAVNPGRRSKARNA